MRSWYLYDGLGSVIAEVSEANGQDYIPQVTATHQTDVYGNPVTPESGSNHRFCGGLGHTTDSDTGLIYMRARYYDPAVGRFISEDPRKDGPNWFVYCRDNPVSLTDSTGMFLDLLLEELIGLEQEGREGAAAEAAKQWGVDKLYKAVAFYSGEITGFLLAGELTSRAVPNGIFIKNASKGRQIFVDLAGDHFDGRLHIDLQDYTCGVKYEKLFLQGLVRGLGSI